MDRENSPVRAWPVSRQVLIYVSKYVVLSQLSYTNQSLISNCGVTGNI